ncbi:hypothetical protein B0H11DRAFT_2278494, partial [Mycena galericulata]
SRASLLPWCLPAPPSFCSLCPPSILTFVSSFLARPPPFLAACLPSSISQDPTHSSYRAFTAYLSRNGDDTLHWLGRFKITLVDRPERCARSTAASAATVPAFNLTLNNHPAAKTHYVVETLLVPKQHTTSDTSNGEETLSAGYSTCCL